MPGGEWVIFLNGSCGVGKSAALDHCGHLLAAARRPFALMDVDWFHRSWPPAPHDPDNVLVEAQNLAAAWSNYRAVGPRQLVVSGVIAATADRVPYEAAFQLPVRSARLEAGPEVAESRLRRRYSPDQAKSLTGHLNRFAEVTRQLADADLDELVVATDNRLPREIARRVLTHFGMLPGPG